MELIDREYMQTLLLALGGSYPRSVVAGHLPEAPGNKRMVNLAYLDEQGLIDVEWSEDLSAVEPEVSSARINARGIDFLKSDGGMSAILGVVTVRLHADTLRELLLNQVEKSNEDPTVKDLVKKQIRELPANAIGTLSERSLEAALGRVPLVANWLLKAIESL